MQTIKSFLATIIISILLLPGMVMAEDLATIDIFSGAIPAKVKVNSWKTLALIVDADNKGPDGNASLKVTSNVTFAGGDYAFKEDAIDLTSYWQTGALSFAVNRTESMDLTGLQLIDKESGTDKSANCAPWIPEIDDDSASWQQVVIPLKQFSDNGEFGGTINDDTCLLMNFQCYPMCDSGPEGERLRKAYQLLAEHANAVSMREGLNLVKRDPLHAYEDGVNLYSTMPRLYYGDPIYIERCLASIASLKKITRIAPDGKRYFFQDADHVGYLNDGEGDDWHYEDDSYFMMVHTALTVAWYNQNPEALKFLREVFDAYLSHMSEDKWPDKIYPADSKITYRTNRPLNFKADSAFVYMYYVTDDKKYLNPFYYGFAKGDWAWASHRSLLDIQLHQGLPEKYKIPEEILASQPYINTILTGDKESDCAARLYPLRPHSFY
ncbi:MAG: hypothetical protein JXR97_10115 [Planctomycetes bacterium]|nr:hypothetical protein [Planctomycetota bacterium]